MQKQNITIRAPRPKPLLCQGKDLNYIFFMPKLTFSQINFHKRQDLKNTLGRISAKRLKRKEINNNLDLGTFTLGFAKSIYNARKLVVGKKIFVNKQKNLYPALKVEAGAKIEIKK